MTSTTQERPRVLARQLGQPIPVTEMEALRGGQTVQPCGDDADRVTHYTNSNHQQENSTPIDCA